MISQLSQDCKILNEARKRYNEIIVNEANLGVYSADKSNHQSLQNGTLFKGMLQRLHVTVNENCQEPVLNLHINESCKYSQ